MNKFFAWSYSRWRDYCLCPLKAKLKYLMKMAEPENEAMARGSAIHKKAEDYLKGLLKTVPKELKIFAALIKKLKSNPTTLAEQSWAFTEKWVACGWFDKACWCRIKVDVSSEITETKVLVVDWKTGKLSDDYLDQTDLYALGAFLKYPSADEVETQLAYVDHPLSDSNPICVTYTRKDLPRLLKDWNTKSAPMMKDKTFAPKPNQKCRWCHYRADNGGPCKF